MKLDLLPRTDLAVRALRSLTDGERKSSEQLAAAIGSTPRFIPHVMRPLVAAGWITSMRGPTGGYMITPEATEVSMLQIIEAVEGPTADRRCVLRDAPCPANQQCALHDVWATARQILTQELALIPVLKEA